MNKQAVIFDMDGVITDSEPFYNEAVNEVLRPLGHVLTEDDHRAIMGSSIDYTWEYVIQRFGLQDDVRRWKRQYDGAVLRILKAKAEPAPGLYALLDRLEAKGLKLALATSSQRNWADAVVARLKVTGRFPVIATTEMVPSAKPAPDLYLLTASLLGVPPARCLAIEDSPRGITSAKAAGMTTVAVRSQAVSHLDISAADRIIDSLEAFDLAWLC